MVCVIDHGWEQLVHAVLGTMFILVLYGRGINYNQSWAYEYSPIPNRLKCRFDCMRSKALITCERSEYTRLYTVITTLAETNIHEVNNILQLWQVSLHVVKDFTVQFCTSKCLLSLHDMSSLSIVYSTWPRLRVHTSLHLLGQQPLCDYQFVTTTSCLIGYNMFSQCPCEFCQKKIVNYHLNLYHVDQRV